MEKDTHILIFGKRKNVPGYIMNEINFIHNTRFQDIEDALLFSFDNIPSSKISLSNDNILYHIFDYIFNETAAIKATFIQNRYHFSKELSNIEGKGEHFLSISKFSDNFHYLQKLLSEFRNLQKTYNSKNYSGFGSVNVKLLKIKKNGKNSCSVIVRKGLTLSPFLYKEKKSIRNNSVAFLIPSKNMESSNISLTNLFIPTFLKTISNKELDRYNITFYIGYDEGDAFFDKEEHAYSVIKKLLPKNVQLKLYKFPKTNWLNFIWNRLFVYAYLDGNNYFFQLNDDIEFISKNWIESSINLLGENIGVVGFNDSVYPCRLFPIALVNRKHFEIFEGQFYPLTFKNWCSDEWIKTVYSDYAICNKNATILNYHPNRYYSCDRRNYLIEVEQGMLKLRKYKNQQK